LEWNGPTTEQRESQSLFWVGVPPLDAMEEAS